jgi:hypothetical protein
VQTSTCLCRQVQLSGPMDWRCIPVQTSGPMDRSALACADERSYGLCWYADERSYGLALSGPMDWRCSHVQASGPIGCAGHADERPYGLAWSQCPAIPPVVFHSGFQKWGQPMCEICVHQRLQCVCGQLMSCIAADAHWTIVNLTWCLHQPRGPLELAPTM